jgi:2-methylisocitrate lyase-like PEP mutase family enzyme
MSTASTNELAAHFKSLHKPGNPVVLTNVYDILSAKAVGGLKNTFALATASCTYGKATSLAVNPSLINMVPIQVL